MHVYYGQIHCYLDYGLLLWGHHVSANHIFVLQKKALRIIYGVSPRTHCKPLFVRANILTLPSMYVLTCLLYVRKNLNEFTTNDTIHDHLTRNKSDLRINKCKFSATKNSFHINSLKLYNSIPLTIRNLPFLAFRRRVKNTLLNNPLYSVDEFYQLKIS